MKPGEVALPVVRVLLAAELAGDKPSFGSSVWKK
jgi:hypothetical protein